MVDSEKLILCDLLILKSKKDSTTNYYVAIIYSSLTQDIEKVFINKSTYDFLEDNPNCDLTEHFYRTYNVYTKKFNLKYYN